ncbi:MAG: cyclic nucleotide-binding domain-containing protein [Leptospirales bacterium]|nr:cyclic nucleotide-binding domain-containing protein [Leptospirales bacterium]
MSFQRIYKPKTLPEAAFLLEEGEALFYLNNTDHYSIKGKKLVIGATELIMRYVLKENVDREEAAMIVKSSALKRIPLEKFLVGIQSYPFLLNVSAVMAKQVFFTTEIIKRLTENLDGNEHIFKELSIKYFLLVERLKEEYAKRKYPWLLSLVKDGENNLIYKRGEVYHRSSVPLKFIQTVDISESMTEYEAGSMICENGSDGSEMYILRRGCIDVFVDKNKIAVIEEEGTIVGEIAMLLGGKRTATLIAKNNVILSKITKEDLKNISSRDLSLMKNIMESLAKRHYYNVTKIKAMNEKIALRSGDTDSNDQTSLMVKQVKELTNKLIEKIEKLHIEKKQDFLKEIIKSF